MRLLVTLCQEDQKLQDFNCSKRNERIGLYFNYQQIDSSTKEELKGQIATLLGGRSAEEVVFAKSQQALRTIYKQLI